MLGTVALVLLLALLTRGHRAAARYAADIAERQVGRLPGAAAIRAFRVPELFPYGVTVISVAIGLFFVYSWLTFVLRRFPYTRPWGEALRGFLLDRLAAFAANVVAAFPDLFTIVLIVLFTRVVVKACRLLFEAVEDGRAVIPWIHPETAQPTRRIVTGLLWLFALALAYPYLPGSNTEAFRGVSVFVGLVISLGSSGIVNQVMSGLTLTYSRALRAGDFVRIGEVEGTVTYLGPLSTKLKTLRNEEITIPNAVVVTAQTTNYSRFSAERGGLRRHHGDHRLRHAVAAGAGDAAAGGAAHGGRAADAGADRAPGRLAGLLRGVRAVRLPARIRPSVRRRSIGCTATSRTPSTSTACRSCRRTTKPIRRARRSSRAIAGSPSRPHRPPTSEPGVPVAPVPD